MNAPPTQDDQNRRTRHLGQCERLAALGMELTEAAHEEALRDMAPRPERRISPYSGLPETIDDRDTTFAELFALLSRCVRQAILLEARLAAGAYDRPDHATPDRIPHHQAASAPAAIAAPPAATTPGLPRLRLEQIEDDLAADTARSASEILAGICAELGTALNTAQDAALRPSPPELTSGEAKHQPAPAARATRRHFPPQPAPISQAERSRLLYIQQGTPPPHKPR